MAKLEFSVDKIENTDNKVEQIDNLDNTELYTSLKGLKELFKFIYPVNSIYISYSHTNPSQLFGGTWERMSQTFLWGTDEEYTIGAQGGEMAHTLTIDEMPTHSHHARQHDNTGTSTAYIPGVVNNKWKSTNLTTSTGGSQPHNNMPPIHKC